MVEDVLLGQLIDALLKVIEDFCFSQINNVLDEPALLNRQLHLRARYFDRRWRYWDFSLLFLHVATVKLLAQFVAWLVRERFEFFKFPKYTDIW